MKERNDGFQHMRDELKDFEFEVPLTGWSEMSAILDGEQPVPSPVVPEKRRRRFGGWFWLIGLFLLFGGGILLGAQQGLYASFANINTTLSALPVPMDAAQPYQNPQPIEEPIADKQPAEIQPSVTARTATTPPIVNTTIQNSISAASPELKSALPAKMQSIDTDQHKEEPLNLIALNEPPVSVETILDRDVQESPIIPALSPDLLEEKASTSALPELYPSTAKRWSFGLKAGADYQPNQTNFLAGGFAQFRLNRKWAIEAGIQYKHRSEDRGDGLGIAAPRGDTIYLPTFASITPFHRPLTRIHFWEAPVTLQYQLTNRLRVLGGAHVGYTRATDQPVNKLFATDEDRASNSGGLTNDYETAIDLTGANRVNTSTNSSKFERWDFGLTAGLDYRIAAHWSVELRYQQGLRDLTPNSFYRNSEANRNSSLQLAVKWHWRKR